MSNHQTTSEKSPKKNLGTESDIVNLILEDHKSLKRLIKVMKDSEKHRLAERAEAFAEFAPLLVAHAKPEEQVLYIYMKQDEDLREGGFEGDVEHQLADQLVEEIMRTDDEDLWSARVKVLAELVEHHIEEEEEDLLPDFKKESEENERRFMGQKFLLLKTKLLEQGGLETPHESRILPRSEEKH
ncbi:MAG: hemerythrin domain-containing protein [Bdellovibrio sp.]|nr:hemerythrin domain-containing protein [Bdellovibrio sp.]